MYFLLATVRQDYSFFFTSFTQLDFSTCLQCKTLSVMGCNNQIQTRRTTTNPVMLPTLQFCPGGFCPAALRNISVSTCESPAATRNWDLSASDLQPSGSRLIFSRYNCQHTNNMWREAQESSPFPPPLLLPIWL